jgi:hypothetical protein
MRKTKKSFVSTNMSPNGTPDSFRSPSSSDACLQRTFEAKAGPLFLKGYRSLWAGNVP